MSSRRMFLSPSEQWRADNWATDPDNPANEKDVPAVELEDDELQSDRIGMSGQESRLRGETR